MEIIRETASCKNSHLKKMSIFLPVNNMFNYFKLHVLYIIFQLENNILNNACIVRHVVHVHYTGEV